MKSSMFGLAGIAACAIFAGCASVPVYHVSEKVNLRDNVSIPPPPAPAPVASVAVKPADANASGIAGHIKNVIESDLSARGFNVLPGKKADVTVSAEVARTETDVMGEWHKFMGTEEIRVSTTLDGRQLAVGSFSVDGERAIDVAKAESRIRDGLAKQTLDWLAKTVTPEKVPVRVPPVPVAPARARLTVAPAEIGTNSMDVLAVQRAFMDAVSAEPGIIDCRLASENPSAKSYEFLVTYEAEAFPNGLLNTLVLKCPGFAVPPCTFVIAK